MRGRFETKTAELPELDGTFVKSTVAAGRVAHPKIREHELLVDSSVCSLEHERGRSKVMTRNEIKGHGWTLGGPSRPWHSTLELGRV
jgi:hypothetical protein